MTCRLPLRTVHAHHPACSPWRESFFRVPLSCATAVPKFIDCLKSRFLFSALRARSSRTSGIGSPMGTTRREVSAFRSWRSRGCHLYLLKTRTVQHGSTLRQLKRYCGGCSTPRANDLSFLVVLFWRAGLLSAVATLTTLGVVLELPFSEEELFFSRENELDITVNAACGDTHRLWFRRCRGLLGQSLPG